MYGVLCDGAVGGGGGTPSGAGDGEAVGRFKDIGIRTGEVRRLLGLPPHLAAYITEYDAVSRCNAHLGVIGGY
jgi:hypothetical protein